MLKNIILSILLVPFSLFGIWPFNSIHWTTDNYRAVKTVESVYEDILILDVEETAGSVKINVGSVDNNIKIQATIFAEPNHEEEVTPDYKKDGNTLNVSTHREATDSFGYVRARGYIDYNITVPKKLKKIMIKTSSGMINIDQVESMVKAKSASGDITIESITASQLTLKSKSGAINLQKARGSQAKIKTASGSITIDNLKYASSTIISRSGSCSINSLQGTVTIETASGKITIADAKISGTIKSRSGSLNVILLESSHDIQLETASGDVKVTLPSDLISYVSARTSAGKIKSDVRVWPEKNKKTQVYVSTRSGDITIKE